MQAQEGIENQKLNKMMPSSDGLADCKTTTRDANLVLGLYSPFKYGLKEYEKYDITKFKNNIRFLQVIEDRDNGSGGQICPLFFDGAVSVFTELPLPEETSAISRVLIYIENNLRRKTNHVFLNFGKKRKEKIKLIKRKLHKVFKRITFVL